MIYYSVNVGPFPIARKESGKPRSEPIPAVFFKEEEAVQCALNYNSSQPTIKAYVMPAEIISASIRAQVEAKK